MARVNSTGANRTATRRAEDRSVHRLIAYETHEFYWRATGTREQLLSAGLCAPSHFPPGRKRVVYGDDGPRTWMLSAVRGGQWQLQIQRTEADRDYFMDLEMARKKIDELPANAENWRADMLMFIENHVEMIGRFINDESGFAFNGADRSAIAAQLGRLLMVVRSATITFDEDKRAATIAVLQAQLGRDAMPRLRPSLRLVVSNERSTASLAQSQREAA